MSIENKTILITRDKNGNKRLSELLLDRGAKVLVWNSFEVEAKVLNESERVKLEQIGLADWLVLTSRYGVEFLKYHLEQYKIDFPNHVKLAVVGPKTKQLCESLGWKVDLVSPTGSLSGLIEESNFKNTKDLTIICPKPEDGLMDFHHAYSSQHQIIDLVLYQKIFCAPAEGIIQSLEEGAIDWVLFFSPSAVHSVMHEIEKKNDISLSKLNIAALGQTTADCLNDYSIVVKVVGTQGNVNKLLKQVASA